MTSEPNNGRAQRMSGAPGELAVPNVSIFRRAAFAGVLFFLFAVPLILLVTAVPTDSALHGVLAQLTVFSFPLWAVFAVWVIFDASALYGIGPRPDPLGPKALRLSALGVAKIASMFLFVIVTRK